MSAHNKKADLRLLALGAAVGLAVAGIGILRQAAPDDTLPEGYVAKVNDVLISHDLYERAISRSIDYAGRPVAADGTDMLQRLIDAELLIQRGIELGMTQSDAAVRQAIIDSLIASVTAEADAASPSDAELAQHLANHADRFSYTASIAAQVWQTDDQSIAQKFAAALRSGKPEPSLEGIASMPDFPPGVMSLEIMASYVGPGIAAAVAEMPTGGSAVFARRGRWLVIRISDKERATLTDLDGIRNRVLIDFRRTLAEQTLQAYIDDLRLRADISAAEL